MKNKKNYQQSFGHKQNHKSKINILKNPHRKQFELLYRSRDSSAQENPIESIIYVKTKRCKPQDKKSKSKVKQSFKKIMNELNDHISNNKNLQSTSKYQQKQLNSTKPSQLKSTISFKKNSKQNYYSNSNKKSLQTTQSKTLNKYNEGNKNNNEQQNSISTFKSLRKKQNNFLSPSKLINKSRSPKNMKKIIQNQLQAKTINCVKINENNQKKYSKNKKNSQNRNKNIQQNNNIQFIKNCINKIPLQIEQYILLDNDFEKIENSKSINKLQTKLLSTYRNFSKQTNKNSSHQNIIFSKIQIPSPQGKIKLENIIQRNKQNNNSDFRVHLKNNQQYNIQNRFYLNSLKIYFQQKIIIIQRWWKNILNLRKQKLKISLQKSIQLINPILRNSIQNPTQTQLKNSLKQQGKITHVHSFPSVQSFDFGQSQKTIDIDNEYKKTKQNNNNQFIDGKNLIKKRRKIAQQKKQTHKSILIKFLRENKITQKVFNQKMSFIEKQYNKNIQQINNLVKILQINSKIIKQDQNKIYQDKKLSQNNFQNNEFILEKIFGHQNYQNQDNKIKQNASQANEYIIKKYKIGGKISYQMQQYIKINKDSKNQFLSDNIQNKYNKKVNQQGQQYYQDNEQSSQNNSSSNSPHKTYETEEIPDFISDTQGRICTFQPNTNFNQILEQFKQQQQIKLQIQKRISIQMGAYKQNNQLCILDTSIIGLHQFLINFFKYYLYYYKDQFLRLINMPYGYQPEKRLKFIQGYIDQSEELSQDTDGIIYGLQYIVSDDVLDAFLEQYYDKAFEQATDAQKQLIQYAKIHSKAVFDCFNMSLNHFRPYYSINGPPYLWNSSQKALTFYFIAQQNIQQVFQKTQFRVLKWASSLIGLLIDKYQHANVMDLFQPTQSGQYTKINFQNLIECYENCSHPSVLDNRQQRLIKQQKTSLVDSFAEWNNFEQQKVSTIYQISSFIFGELMLQIVNQYSSM